MKRSFTLATFAVACATIAFAMSGVWAADSAATAPAGKLDDKTTGNSIRASQLMGANIQNSKGESVGEISDVVLDAARGKVSYAAVTYGGLMGIGDKMFAVPWEAFRCVQDPDDADDYYLVLDVTPEKLEGATGFDQDSWPNFADASFKSQLDTRYGIKRDAQGNVEIRINR
jgi:sporulation protein YlmC with PRC-barrel domain